MKEIHTEKKHGKAPRRIGGLIVSACVAAAALLSAGTAKASLLVYEGFNGYTTGSLSGQVATGTGLTGSYAGSTAFYYQTSGLTFSGLQVSGGAANSFNYPSSALTVSLSSSAATTGTLYSSFLYKTTGTSGSNAYLSVGPTEHFTTYASFGAGAATNYGGTRVDTYTTLSAAITYLCITKTTNVGLALSSGTMGLQQSWFMTEAQFATWQANGLAESYLTSATVGTGDSQIAARTSASAATSGTYLFDGTQNLILNANWNNKVVFDEIRYGTALGDVIVVPEPSTLALMLVAGIAGAATLRRRQAA